MFFLYKQRKISIPGKETWKLLFYNLSFVNNFVPGFI